MFRTSLSLSLSPSLHVTQSKGTRHPTRSLGKFDYFRTLLACLTRFSITPSNASLSPIALSLFFSQCSNTSLALAVSSSSFLTCPCSSSSVILHSAAWVVAHSILVVCRLSSGAEGGPFFRRLDLLPDGWSTEAELALSCFSRTRESVRRPFAGD